VSQQSGVHTHVLSMHCVCDVIGLVIREGKQSKCYFAEGPESGAKRGAWGTVGGAEGGAEGGAVWGIEGEPEVEAQEPPEPGG